MARPDLDRWLARPTVTVAHRREAGVTPEALWEAAKTVRLSDTARLGRLIRWRIPGTTADIGFDTLFRQAPFTVLEDGTEALVSGLVGKIWTLRRDYPRLADAQAFRNWSGAGTVRVLFGNWAEGVSPGAAALCSETRIEAYGAQGRLGLAAVRPLIAGFHHLVGSEGLEAALAHAQRARL